jgi:spermidine/putrescine transport system permease protein/putrescine transport system permease protein
MLPVVLGLPVTAWQILFFAAPLLFLIVITFWQVRSFRLEPAFVFDNWTRILGSAVYYRALAHTLAVAAATTVLALAIAFPAAYTIVFRLSARHRDLAVAFLIVPIFSSYLLRIYAWQIMLSPEGIVNSLLGALGADPVPLLGGDFSLQVGLLTLTLPVVVLITIFGLAGVDKTLIEAAENLGCRRAKVIAHVILPAIRPALILAGSTAFLLSFGDYISPLFMTGSKPPTLSILIVDTVKSGSQWPRASVVGVSMLVILAVVFGLSRLLASASVGIGRSTWRRLGRRAAAPILDVANQPAKG